MSLIDDSGFVRTRLPERKAQLEAAVKGIFGTDLDLSAETPDGQLLGIFAEAIADLDELAEAVFNARSPAGARGAGLSRLVRLNGVTRKPEAFSTAGVTLSGVPSTVIPAGSLIANAADPTAVFETTATLTIGGGGTVTGTARATVPGPVVALAASLMSIQTVISGWTGATNPVAATLGTAVETDAALRVRRAMSVAIPSQGILDGLNAALLQVPDVTRSRVYENPTDIIDANGLPRHSIQCIVEGGANDKIAEAIWLKKSLGVTQVGAVEQPIVDGQGTTQIIKFDRPIVAPIWIHVVMDPLPGTATQAAMKAAIVAWGREHSDIGTDVIRSQLYVPINSVPGLNIRNVFLGLSSSPTEELNLVIPYNAVASWETTQIVLSQSE